MNDGILRPGKQGRMWSPRMVLLLAILVGATALTAACSAGSASSPARPPLPRAVPTRPAAAAKPAAGARSAAPPRPAACLRMPARRRNWCASGQPACAVTATRGKLPRASTATTSFTSPSRSRSPAGGQEVTAVRQWRARFLLPDLHGRGRARPRGRPGDDDSAARAGHGGQRRTGAGHDGDRRAGPPRSANGHRDSREPRSVKANSAQPTRTPCRPEPAFPEPAARP
jgi:hypothetical protein